MKKILIPVFFLCLMQFACCTKHSSDPPIPIDTFLVDHFNYKPDTYWIYKDSLSGEVDSFFVHDNTFGTNTGLNDYIDINIFQNNSAQKWFVSLTTKAIGMEYNGNIFINYNFFIIVPFKVGLLGYNDHDSGYVVSVNNNYTINSGAYTNVAKVRHLNHYGTVNAHFDNTFYFNSDVGIIKMDLNQDTHKI